MVGYNYRKHVLVSKMLADKWKEFIHLRFILFEALSDKCPDLYEGRLPVSSNA